MINLKKKPARWRFDAILPLLRHAIIMVLAMFACMLIAALVNGDIAELLIKVQGFVVGVLWGILVVIHVENKRMKDE